MTIISIWSPVHRQAGVSTLASLLAVMMVSKGDSVLVTTNDLRGFRTAGEYLSKAYNKSKVKSLCQLARNGMLSNVKDIVENSHEVSKGLIVGSLSNDEISIAPMVSDSLYDIAAAGHDDINYMIIDTKAHNMDESSELVLSMSDVQIVCIPQDSLIQELWVARDELTYSDSVKENFNMLVSGIHCEYGYAGINKMQKILKQDVYHISQCEFISRISNDRSVFEAISKEIEAKSKIASIIELEAIYGHLKQIEKDAPKERIKVMGHQDTEDSGDTLFGSDIYK